MRSLFLLMLAANIAYLGWNLVHPVDEGRPAQVVLPSGTPTLELLSETVALGLAPDSLPSQSEASDPSDQSSDSVLLGQAQEPSPAVPELAQEHPPEMVHGDEPMPTAGEAERVEEVSPSPDAGDAEMVVSQSPETGTELEGEGVEEVSPSEGAGEAEVPVPQSPERETEVDHEVPDAIEGPSFSSETEETAPPASEAQTEPEATEQPSEPYTEGGEGASSSEPADSERLAEPEAAAIAEDQMGVSERPSAPQRACFTLGPLEEEQRATELAEAIRQLGFAAKTREQPVEETDTYWVYLPPLESREAAQAVVKRLTENGMNDYYIVRGRDQDQNNAVSLGLFKRQEGAERRAERVREIGLEPEIQERHKQRLYYWVDYDEGPDLALPPEVWIAFEAAENAIQRAERECE